MGKVTFRRVVNTLGEHYIVAALPVAGGLLFLAGSFCFLPHSSRQTLTAGAACFLVGSCFYWAAPFLDFWELTHNHANLLEPPVDLGKSLSARQDTDRVAALYEHLYKAHMLRIQRANCLLYMVGGAFFVGGSTLFFPAMDEIIYHGGWLYITGCTITLAGATLAMFSAREMRKTALPLRFLRPPPVWALPFWADEEATERSCQLYIAGNGVYIVGSVFFFPKVIEVGGLAIEYLAVVLFVLGSIFFVVGALIDLIVLLRSPLLARPTSAHLRGLELARRTSEAARHATPSSKYLQMADEGGGEQPAGTPPRGVTPQASGSIRESSLSTCSGANSPAVDSMRSVGAHEGL